MNSRVRIGKYKVKTTFLFAVIAVVLLIVGIIIGAAAGRRAKRKEAEQRLGGSFNTLPRKVSLSPSTPRMGLSSV